MVFFQILLSHLPITDREAANRQAIECHQILMHDCPIPGGGHDVKHVHMSIAQRV